MKTSSKTTTLIPVALLLLMLAPLASLRSQETSRADDPPAPQKLVAEEPAQQSGSLVRVSGFVIDDGPANTRTNLFAWVRQEPAQTTTPQKTNNDYVFPSAERRLKRYVRSMVGPFAILRVGVSAGLDQWSDSPEEWGQGAEGYGKRFASQFGKNAIR